MAASLGARVGDQSWVPVWVPVWVTGWVSGLAKRVAFLPLNWESDGTVPLYHGTMVPW